MDASPSSRAGLPVRLPGALPVALGLLAWRFAWDNARTIAGLPIPRLLPIPRAFRLAEIGLVLLLLAAVLLRPSRMTAQRAAGTVLVLLVALLGILSGVIGTISGYVELGPSLQMVYAYTVPLLVGGAVSGLASREGDAERVLTWFVTGVSVAVVAGWYQAGPLGLVGDAVHGLMRDAHHFASACWLAVLWLVARLWARHGSPWRSAAGLVAIAPVAFIAANEKATAAVAVTVALALVWWLWRHGWVARAAVVTSFAALAIYVHGIATNRIVPPWSINRYWLVAQSFGTGGLVEAYRKLPTVMREQPRALLIGTGPGSYGSAKALDHVPLGGDLPPLALRYTASSYRLSFLSAATVGSYVEESTDLSAFIVEFGPLALLLLTGSAVVLLMVPGLQAMRREVPAHRAMGAWLVLGTIYAAQLAAVTTFYGWSTVELTTWPLALVAALLPTTLDPATTPAEG